MRYPLVLTTFVMALAASQAVRADVIITLESKDLKTHATQRIDLYAKDNRIAYRGKDGTGMIFDGDRQVSWNYDTRHGLYMEMTAENARAIRRLAKENARKRRDAYIEQMKTLPTERRKLMEKHLASPDRRPRYKRLGGTRRVKGWRCAPVARVDAAGRVVERMCIASFEQLGIAPKDRKVFESMDRFVALMGPDLHSTHSRFTLQAKEDLALHGIAIHDRYSTISTTIISVRHEDVPDDVFQLPKGLRKITLMTPGP